MSVARNTSRPLYEQSPLENFSSAACAEGPSHHGGGPAVLAEKAEKRAFLRTLSLGAPRGFAVSKALCLCTNGDMLLGRADNGEL